MPYTTGKSGNPAGRPAGCLNKASAPARALIAEALAGTGAAALRQRLEALDNRAFLQTYIRLARLIFPQPRRTARPANRLQVTLDTTAPRNATTPT